MTQCIGKTVRQVADFAGQIKQLETKADKLKSTFRLNMPRSLFLPVDRKDLLSLIGDQDKIADTTEDIGKTFLFREMTVPDRDKRTVG